MEKESMKAYLCAMKNMRVRVTGRNPLTFTVNGCEDLQEFRERLFNAQFDALGYCAGVLDGGAANAGTIRVLRAMLKGVRNTILLDKQGRPHRRRCAFRHAPLSLFAETRCFCVRCGEKDWWGCGNFVSLRRLVY